MGDKEFVYTGERMIPEYEPLEWNRDVHYTRYRYAAQFVQPDSDILDCGCGVGYGTQLLAHKTTGNVVGVDKKEAIEYALGHYPARNIRYKVADLELPWYFGSFDIVVSFDVIEHLHHPGVCLKSMADQLRNKSALAFVSTVHSMRADNFSPRNRFHVREYTLGEFYELLTRYFYMDNLLMNMGMMAVLRQKSVGESTLARDVPFGAIYFRRIEDELNRQYDRVEVLETKLAQCKQATSMPRLCKAWSILRADGVLTLLRTIGQFLYWRFFHHLAAWIGAHPCRLLATYMRCGWYIAGAPCSR